MVDTLHSRSRCSVGWRSGSPSWVPITSCCRGRCGGWGRFAEAEPLYVRALEIRERTLPADHEDLQAVRDDYAKLKQLANDSVR